MVRLAILILCVLLARGVTSQLHGRTDCSQLQNEYDSFCRASVQSAQGAPGKRGATGNKGEKGERGVEGEKGDDGLVDYRRVNDIVAARTEGPACSMNVKHDKDHYTLSSSGMYDSRSKPEFAKLDGQSSSGSSGAWCGRTGENDWIVITFDGPRLVAGIVTQGSPSSNHWTITYHVSCFDHGVYSEYAENGKTKTFSGNTNRNSKVFNIFSEAMSCRSIRIMPLTWRTRPCLRIELLHEGCYAPAYHKFVVTSRGADDGAVCNITVNGIEKSKAQRGFCVVGFDPNSLSFSIGNFDTYRDKLGESPRLSSFLDSLQMNSIVAIAAQDTAKRSNIDQSVDTGVISRVKSLGAVGVSCDLGDYEFRDAFAFIGQKLPNDIERPEWTSCQHVRRYKGYAVVHATIRTTRRFVVH